MRLVAVSVCVSAARRLEGALIALSSSALPLLLQLQRYRASPVAATRLGPATHMAMLNCRKVKEAEFNLARRHHEMKRD
ncbi:hypothetical protein PR202_gb00061 [Eleusine coracana subsp. coracana]|uniref:Secreted protein n=1 Tax=Eleusine coracana subsp. coracana TaxID=191504 RepID=A0AAV5DS90_ELECO|nr:hypothetical protein PR202_gb00061 [Eleusine coracana subsp. coracana]